MSRRSTGISADESGIGSGCDVSGETGYRRCRIAHRRHRFREAGSGSSRLCQVVGGLGHSGAEFITFSLEKVH